MTHIALTDGTVATFQAPVVGGSALPALLGRRSMKAMRVLLDLIHDRSIVVGPGGFELTLSPGSVSYQLHESRSGHLLLPCTAWEAMRGATVSPIPKPVQAFVAEDSTVEESIPETKTTVSRTMPPERPLQTAQAQRQGQSDTLSFDPQKEQSSVALPTLPKTPTSSVWVR